jgi:hypothetical protein
MDLARFSKTVRISDSKEFWSIQDLTARISIQQTPSWPRLNDHAEITLRNPKDFEHLSR